MGTLWGWILQVIVGWLVAAGCYRLVKAPQGKWRVAGWVLGLLYGWSCVNGLYWDFRMLMWGHISFLVTGLIHGSLLGATVLALAKGAKESSPRLAGRAAPVPQLPRRL